MWPLLMSHIGSLSRVLKIHPQDFGGHCLGFLERDVMNPDLQTLHIQKVATCQSQCGGKT